MKPLFSVGEEVILQSVQHPPLNGEYTVEKILRGGEEAICHVTNFRYIKRQEYGVSYFYVLAGLSDKTVMSDGVTREIEMHWYEKALRKKHKPSEGSFERMMNKLKTPLKSPQSHSERTS